MLNNERCRELQTEFKMATRGGRDLLLMLLKWIGLHYQRSKSISLVRIDKHTGMEANVGWTESDGWEEFVQYYSKIFENRKRKTIEIGFQLEKKKHHRKCSFSFIPPIATLPVIVDLMTFIWSTPVGRLAQKHSHIHTQSHCHTHIHMNTDT